MKKWIEVLLFLISLLYSSTNPPYPKINPPANVTIIYSDSTVTIGWDSVPNTSKYYIYDQDDPYGVFVLIDSTAVTSWNGSFTGNKKFFYISAKETSPPAGFVYVQGGTFKMGDHFSEGYSIELPVHSVTLNSFNIGKFEVTQSEWAAYMPVDTYNFGSGATYPVYYVSWYEIIKYCNLRSIAEGLTPCYTISSSTDPVVWGTVPTSSNSTWNATVCNWSVNGYRLPSEAEWEYAARGGIHNADNLRYSGCNLETELTNYAWYYGNYTGTFHPVGEKLPNQLGIYDMSGSEWEWCWDWYGSSYYTTCNNLGTVTNPYGPTTGSLRAVRGGFWCDEAFDCRVAIRGAGYPYSSNYIIGFRLARTP